MHEPMGLPLQMMLSKNKPTIWGLKEKIAMKTLKKITCKATALRKVNDLVSSEATT
ncbi:hypothetical protein Scep_009897 [Stephania cephalantha]|uniref:Uncharacterized protein n=1 Tax=Stephania cephalantha TaxID=152367 RepID=A0AAP0PGP9_9MAGN